VLIYETLKKDHDKLKKLLAELVDLDDKSPRRKTLVRRIRDELIPHARAEESVFYNSLRSFDSAKGEVMHGFREHMEAETFLRTLQVMDGLERGWKKVARQLKKAVESHVRDEEGRIFPIAKEILTDEEAREMNTAFVRMKEEVKDESFFKNTMEMVANLMPPRLTRVFRSSGQDARY
jgi:hemerythrin superfamily protein